MASTRSVAAMPKDKAGDVVEPLGPELTGAEVCLAVWSGEIMQVELVARAARCGARGVRVSAQPMRASGKCQRGIFMSSHRAVATRQNSAPTEGLRVLLNPKYAGTELVRLPLHYRDPKPLPTHLFEVYTSFLFSKSSVTHCFME